MTTIYTVTSTEALNAPTVRGSYTGDAAAAKAAFDLAESLRAEYANENPDSEFSVALLQNNEVCISQHDIGVVASITVHANELH